MAPLTVPKPRRPSDHPTVCLALGLAWSPSSLVRKWTRSEMEVFESPPLRTTKASIPIIVNGLPHRGHGTRWRRCSASVASLNDSNGSQARSGDVHSSHGPDQRRCSQPVQDTQTQEAPAVLEHQLDQRPCRVRAWLQPRPTRAAHPADEPTRWHPSYCTSHSGVCETRRVGLSGVIPARWPSREL
jgi:hypothetical protein